MFSASRAAGGGALLRPGARLLRLRSCTRRAREWAHLAGPAMRRCHQRLSCGRPWPDKCRATRCARPESRLQRCRWCAAFAGDDAHSRASHEALCSAPRVRPATTVLYRAGVLDVAGGEALSTAPPVLPATLAAGVAICPRGRTFVAARRRGDSDESASCLWATVCAPRRP